MIGENFAAGIKVLVVDDDRTCLRIYSVMLRRCNYNVTECREAKQALEFLRNKKGNFDLVLTDVNMPDMDGFKLLEIVGLEMDLPVIMITDDLSKAKMKKAVFHGACDFLSKPVKIETIKYIWQHVLRRKIPNNNNNNTDNTTNNIIINTNNIDNNNNIINHNSIDKNNMNNDNDDDDNNNNNNNNNKESASGSVKKKRFQWTRDLHELFLHAIVKLGGINVAVPTKILEIMNIPGLERAHVASHLQKYRQVIRRAMLLNNQVFTGQPIRRKNSQNAPKVLANSHNMPLLNYRHREQFHLNNLLINGGLAGLINNNINRTVANNISNGLTGHSNNNNNHVAVNNVSNGLTGHSNNHLAVNNVGDGLTCHSNNNNNHLAVSNIGNGLTGHINNNNNHVAVNILGNGLTGYSNNNNTQLAVNNVSNGLMGHSNNNNNHVAVNNVSNGLTGHSNNNNNHVAVSNIGNGLTGYINNNNNHVAVNNVGNRLTGYSNNNNNHVAVNNVGNGLTGHSNNNHVELNDIGSDGSGSSIVCFNHDDNMNHDNGLLDVIFLTRDQRDHLESPDGILTHNNNYSEIINNMGTLV